MEKIQEILNKVKNVLPFFYNNFENCDFFKATKLINFDYWQKNGLHITPNHFYSPIPDTSKFKNKDFSEKSLVGININIEKQLYMLKLLSKFKTEFNKFKLIKEGVDSQTDSNYYFNNLAFDNVDALSYYGLIRLLKPKKIIEIGSGWSTKIAAQACLENKNTKLFAIEPYPQIILRKGFLGFFKLIVKKVENVNLDIFEKLEDGDILFIDSSHVARFGSDVNHIFFEILPRLKKGVYVHIHDVFFPYDYPKSWVITEHRFWSEQYLLHAFLLFNNSFEVILANNYLIHKFLPEVKRTFPNSPSFGGGSFWMRKVK